MIDVKRSQKNNDKIVVIENAPYSLVKQVLTDFTANYDNPQQQHLKPFSKLHKVTDNKTVVTFPYDIDFEIFCYLVNYLKYPFEIQYSPKIKAWTTTKSSYNWLNSKLEDKKVMLFIDPNDKEYDNVMLTTEDNVQFKIGFAVGEGLQQQNRVIYQYENPDIEGISVVLELS